MGGGIALLAFRSKVTAWRNACIAAFQFLTRFPLPLRIDYTDQVFRRSVVFYPFVGAVIGLLLTLVAAGLRLWLPGFPAAAILLSLWIMLTGALHLDGLMDTADGILSHRSREKMLEIMRDSRVGAMGVIVCVLYLLLKLSFIMELLDGTWDQAAVFFCCIPIWSRWFTVLSIIGWPYAREGSTGMGGYFRSVRFRHFLGATLIAAIFTLGALWLTGFGGYRLMLYFLGFPLICGLLGWGIAKYLHQKLGGLTGDTYGAINELLELFMLFAVLIIWN